MPDAADEPSPQDQKLLVEQRARLRFLRDEGLAFLSTYRSLTLPEDKEAIWRLLVRHKTTDGL